MRDHANRTGGYKRRRTTPKVVRAVRDLVEGGTLPVREIAARTGVSRKTVMMLRSRHGWTRPRPARLPMVGRRGGGHAIVPEVVEAARELMEGSTLSYKAIAARTGVARTTLCRWRKQHGWQRPAGAPTALPGERADGRPRPFRSLVRRGHPLSTDAVEGARHLLTTTLLSQANIARQIGVSQWWVGDILRKRGWLRPLGRPGTKPFAASVRTGALQTDGDRRGRPYAAAMRKEAQLLWEDTRLSTEVIGARLGAHPGTVARWAKEGGWERPKGRSSRAKLRGYFGRVLGAGRPRSGAGPRIRRF